jgi:hypothetical protein
MKRRRSLGVALLLFAMQPTPGHPLPRGQDRADDGSIQDRFIGAWRLLWLEEEGADGKIHRAECTGMLVFSREGRMSVQVMYRDPQPGTSAAGPVQYAQGGYEASFGRYEVDASASSFTYHVEGALVRSLVGKDLTRLFELSGTRLIVKSSNPTEHWRVAWEHY